MQNVSTGEIFDLLSNISSSISAFRVDLEGVNDNALKINLYLCCDDIYGAITKCVTEDNPSAKCNGPKYMLSVYILARSLLENYFWFCYLVKEKDQAVGAFQKNHLIEMAKILKVYNEKLSPELQKILNGLITVPKYDLRTVSGKTGLTAIYDRAYRGFCMYTHSTALGFDETNKSTLDDRFIFGLFPILSTWMLDIISMFNVETVNQKVKEVRVKVERLGEIAKLNGV